MVRLPNKAGVWEPGCAKQQGWAKQQSCATNLLVEDVRGLTGITRLHNDLVKHLQRERGCGLIFAGVQVYWGAQPCSNPGQR